MGGKLHLLYTFHPTQRNHTDCVEMGNEKQTLNVQINCVFYIEETTTKEDPNESGGGGRFLPRSSV